jgi:hypothetical protein
VSNAKNGTIAKFTEVNNPSQFISGLTQPKGLCIVGDILYVADVTKLVAIDLQTAEKKFSVAITDSKFLNDICSDGGDLLYITDTQMNSIYKFKISTQEYYPLQLKGSIQSPNGILYMDGNLIIVSFITSSPISQVDLSTNNVKILRTTNLDLLDGIQYDGSSTFYISSWKTTSQSGVGFVHSIGKDFSGDFTLVAEKLSGPADFLLHNNKLVIPEMNANKITIIDFNSVEEEKNIINLNSEGLLMFQTEILPPYSIEIYNLQGKLVISETTDNSTYKIDLPTGTYFVRINGKSHGKILISR